MKRLLLLLLITALKYYSSFGQQSIFNLTSSSKIGTVELEYINDLDIFSYFKLTDYDTELKQSVFKKTEEGQSKLTELKRIKAEMLKTTYYVKLSNKFTNSDYDIKKGGFSIFLGKNISAMFVLESQRSPKSIAFNDSTESWIFLKALPSKQIASTLWDNKGGVYEEILFLTMSEESGLEVENDRENTEVYFFFTPNGREQTVFKVYEKNLISDDKWYDIKHNDLKADKVRIVVANKLSGKILYDKFFSYQVPSTKK